jgi:hypothetical protein
MYRQRSTWSTVVTQHHIFKTMIAIDAMFRCCLASSCHTQPQVHTLTCSLASKLKTAQVSRERHLQLQEKTILESQAREYENLFAEKLEKQRQEAIIAEDEKQHLRRLDNFKAREKLEVGFQTLYQS